MSTCGFHDWSAVPGGYKCLGCGADITDREVGLATKFTYNSNSEEPILNQKLTYIYDARTIAVEPVIVDEPKPVEVLPVEPQLNTQLEDELANSVFRRQVEEYLKEHFSESIPEDSQAQSDSDA